MSLIEEIHNQRPAVRYTMFALASAIVISTVGYFTFSSVQKDIFFATHSDAEEQQAFLTARDAVRPKPLAALARAAGSLTASIASFIGWDRSAGFDRNEQDGSMQGGVHLLPQSE